MIDLNLSVDDDEARDAQHWADHLGIDMSDLLREALQRHLVWLISEHESSLGSLAAWCDTEYWSDWLTWRV